MVNQAIHMVLLNPFCLALIFIGVVIGIIFGSIPGLSASMALILFLPMSFGMEPMNGIALLVGLYLGGISFLPPISRYLGVGIAVVLFVLFVVLAPKKGAKAEKSAEAQ